MSFQAGTQHRSAVTPSRKHSSALVWTCQITHPSLPQGHQPQHQLEPAGGFSDKFEGNSINKVNKGVKKRHYKIKNHQEVCGEQAGSHPTRREQETIPRGAEQGQRGLSNTQNSRTDSYSLLLQKSKKTFTIRKITRVLGPVIPSLLGTSFTHFRTASSVPVLAAGDHYQADCLLWTAQGGGDSATGPYSARTHNNTSFSIAAYAPVGTTESQVPAAAARLTCQCPGFLPGKRVTLGLP